MNLANMSSAPGEPTPVAQTRRGRGKVFRVRMYSVTAVVVAVM